MFRGLISSMPAGAGREGFIGGSSISALVHAALVGAALIATHKGERPVVVTPIDLGEVTWRREPREPKPSDLPWGLRPYFPVIRGPVVAPISVPPIPPISLGGWPAALKGLADGAAMDSAEPTAANSEVYVESAVDELPERLRTPPLEYPALLQQAGIEGVVIVEVILDSAGTPEPETLRVLRSDHRAFDGPAKRAVLASVFRPGRVRGRPVRVLVQIPVSFTIRRH